MAFSRRVLTMVAAAFAAVLWFSAPMVRAQFDPPPGDEATEKPDPKKNAKVEGFKKPTAKSKINSAQAGKLRLLELQAGARTKAGATPNSQNIAAPPLDPRELAIHALNRLGFGPRPGEADDIIQRFGA